MSRCADQARAVALARAYGTASELMVAGRVRMGRPPTRMRRWRCCEHFASVGVYNHAHTGN